MTTEHGGGGGDWGAWRLIPEETEARVEVRRESGQNPTARRWSLLTPEVVSCREAAAIHCHVGRPALRVSGGGWEVELELDEPRCRVCTSLVPLPGRDIGTLALELRMTNTGGTPMTDTEVDYCFSCARFAWHRNAAEAERSWVTEAFHGARREQNTEWTTRSMVGTPNGLVVVGDINRHFPVAVHRKLPGGNLAWPPLILCQSTDRREVYAAGWERASRLYCAIGSCIHTVAWLGTIAPGATSLLRGRFCHAQSDPYRVLATFQRDLGL